MSLPKADLLKVAVLLFLLGLCLYNGIQKFFFKAIPAAQIRIEPDYSVCDRNPGYTTDSEINQKCHAIVEEATKRATEQCKGYIKKLVSCKQGHRSCRSEQENVASCVNAIVEGALKDEIPVQAPTAAPSSRKL
jgi:hypothetical protein